MVVDGDYYYWMREEEVVVKVLLKALHPALYCHSVAEDFDWKLLEIYFGYYRVHRDVWD